MFTPEPEPIRILPFTITVTGGGVFTVNAADRHRAVARLQRQRSLRKGCKILSVEPANVTPSLQFA